MTGSNGNENAEFVLDFDELVRIHEPTVTRIKCIGDCYMAAGGIFMEANQPAVHAKDIVDFWARGNPGFGTTKC
jgi:hypothetical protein